MGARTHSWSRRAARAFVCATILASGSSATSREATAAPFAYVEASYYADMFHGRQTASGELFDMHGRTAAHRELKFGTRVRVTNLKNGRKIIVRINDRGPYVGERAIDLSYGAARKLRMVEAGVVPVDIKVLRR
jgi:rare lipoprotein A